MSSNVILPRIKGSKRLLPLSDFHCGSRVGLTAPEDQGGPHKKEQANLWEWTKFQIQKILPVDYLLLNGDVIDGPNPRGGGSQQITTSSVEQIEMAYRVLLELGLTSSKNVKDQIMMTYGTAYHTGKVDDFEKILAVNLKAKIDDKLRMRIPVGKKKWVVTAKHHTKGSSIPHGPATVMSKDWLWDAVAGGVIPDVYIHSHVHRYYRVDQLDGTTVLSTPALQGAGVKYARAMANAIVHFGFVYIDFYEDDFHIHKVWRNLQVEDETEIKLA
jgi:hypothetical protein